MSKSEKIRIFVGTDVNGGCAECQMVFEYSLRKHASRPVEIVWMKISDDPESFWYGWNTSTWSTPFSGFRYGIAEYCHFNGKAIYCDDDQLWLDDAYKLWQDEPTRWNVMTGKILPNGEVRHCVSVIDNRAFGIAIQDHKALSIGKIKHDPNFVEWMKQKTFRNTQKLDDRWNCYDGENMALENIGILHMTDMSTNPGVALAVKRLGDQSKHWYDGPIRPHRRQDVIDIFQKYYEEAIDAGYRVEDYLPENRIAYGKQTQKDYIANNGYDVTQGQ